MLEVSWWCLEIVWKLSGGRLAGVLRVSKKLKNLHQTKKRKCCTQNKIRVIFKTAETKKNARFLERSTQTKW